MSRESITDTSQSFHTLPPPCQCHVRVLARTSEMCPGGRRVEAGWRNVVVCNESASAVGTCPDNLLTRLTVVRTRTETDDVSRWLDHRWSILSGTVNKFKVNGRVSFLKEWYRFVNILGKHIVYFIVWGLYDIYIQCRVWKIHDITFKYCTILLYGYFQ